MSYSDISDGSAAAEDANSSLPAPGKSGDAVHDIAAVGDFHDVGSESIGAVPGYDDGGLGLVLGARGAAPGSPRDLALPGTGGAQFLTFQGGGGGGGVLVAIALDAAAN